jgi:hypothetical protein
VQLGNQRSTLCQQGGDGFEVPEARDCNQGSVDGDKPAMCCDCEQGGGFAELHAEFEFHVDHLSARRFPSADNRFHIDNRIPAQNRAIGIENNSK